MNKGAKVVIIDLLKDIPQNINQDKLRENEIYYISADVTDSNRINKVVKMIIKKFGNFDVLINCAGITRRMPAETFDEKAFDLVIDVNLKGTFICCKEFGSYMLENGCGCIINIASLGAHVAITNSVAYCASKGGVAQLTKTLAVEWANRGVRVNALTPGVFETPLLKQCIEQDEEYGERMLQKIPMNRFGKPSEIAGPAMFLASEYASYITGHILCVDAGYLAQ